MEPPTPRPARRPSFVRAFLPFWFTLVWAALVGVEEFHRRQAALARLKVSVTVERQQPESGFTVEVNGQPLQLSDPVPLGFAKIRISAQDAESRLIERFVWYGVTDLGSVDLTRSRGSLSAFAEPAADSYELRGRGGAWINVTGSFAEVPTGEYELTARFGELSERTAVTVVRQQTERIAVPARIGSLELVATPAGGDYELSARGTGDRWSGTFPATFRRLRAGNYRLIARRPGYERELEITVRPNETNRSVVKFVYGAAEITTMPAGATLEWRGTPVGRSPLILTNLVPGTHRLTATLTDHDPLQVEVTVTGETTNAVALKLVNTRFREAMERARRNEARNHFEDAESDLGEALAIHPGDPVAQKLLTSVRWRGLKSRAEQLAQDRDFEGALKALEAAAKERPEDATIPALQAKYLEAKTTAEQQQVEARFRQLLTEATAAANRQDFKGASALHDEAKKILPSRPDLAELEASFQKELTKMVFEAAEKQRADEIASRPTRFKAAWELAISRDPDADSSPLIVWRTGKSAAELRAALERIGAANTKLKMSEVNAESADIFTAKLGALLPALQVGSYMRIGVATYKESDTMILLKVYLVERGLNTLSPDSRADSLRNRAEGLRQKLVEDLNANIFKP